MVAVSYHDQTYGMCKQRCLNACDGAGYFDISHPSGARCVCTDPFLDSVVSAFGVACFIACCAACAAGACWYRQCEPAGVFIAHVFMVYIIVKRLAETQHTVIE